MRYLISKKEIRTENAAKPTGKPARWLKEYILDNLAGKVAVDYGCGKLRYAVLLARKFLKVYVIDSRVQIERVQVINGETTSILEYARKPARGISPLIVEDLDLRNLKADFVLCANVLSAVPFPAERKRILANIRKVLGPKSRALISVQYKNAYFTEKLNDPKSLLYRDGFMLETRGGWSFYGIIPPERLKRLLNSSGYDIVAVKLNEGSAYITVKRGV